MNAGSARFAYEYASRPNVFPLNNVIEQGTNCSVQSGKLVFLSDEQ